MCNFTNDVPKWNFFYLSYMLIKKPTAYKESKSRTNTTCKSIKFNKMLIEKKSHSKMLKLKYFVD